MFVQSGDLEYFQFDYLRKAGLKHGIFTRRGGISPAPWDSLNLGGLVGDERLNIIENRRRIFNALQLPVSSQFSVWLVHSNQILVSRKPKHIEEPFLRVDGILTDQNSVTLTMLFADCVPIYFYDPTIPAIGIVHAGWLGTIKKIAASAVEKMIAEFGSKPDHIWAGIGPSIGPDHFEVKEDVVSRFEKVFKNDTDLLVKRKDNRTWLDLWAANQLVLNHAGVSNVEISGCCTACDTARWFSHRAENGKTGRFMGVLSLERTDT